MSKEKVTNLAVQRLVHMIHPPSLGKRFKGRKRESLNLGICNLEEVVLKDNVDLLVAHRPALHTDFTPNGSKVVQIRTGPAPKDVFEECILRPTVIRLVEQSNKELQL